MLEGTGFNQSSNRGAWARLLFSGMPLAVFLTALFYLQGRAFRTGYIDALGLNASQFPIDTTEALWQAFNGWLYWSMAVFDHVRWPFVGKLLATALVIFVLVLLYLGLLWMMARYIGPVAPAKPVATVLTPNTERFQFKSLFKTTAFATLLGTLGLPLTLATAAVIVMASFISLVYPFYAQGKQAAWDECKRPQTTASQVTLAGESSPTTYLLECSKDFCALLDARGARIVLPREAVQKVEVPMALNANSSNSKPRCVLPGS